MLDPKLVEKYREEDRKLIGEVATEEEANKMIAFALAATNMMKLDTRLSK